MERALGFWKSGSLESGDTASQRKRKEFNEVQWGSVTERWAEMIALIDSARWDCIIADALAVSASPDDDGPAEDVRVDGGVDSRSLIILD